MVFKVIIGIIISILFVTIISAVGLSFLGEMKKQHPENKQYQETIKNSQEGIVALNEAPSTDLLEIGIALITTLVGAMMVAHRSLAGDR